MAGRLFQRPGNPQHEFPSPQQTGPDNPPFGKRSWLPVVLASWVTVAVPVWQTIQVPDAQAQVPPERAWVSNVLAQWEPDQQPTQGRRFVPQVVAAPQVDNPPFGAKNYQSTRLWEADTWLAQKQRTQVQPAVADQPYGAHPWLLIEWVDDDVTPQARRFIPQPGITVVQDQPYARRVQASWEEDWTRQPRRFVPQVNVVTTDQPFNRNWLSTIQSQWEPDWSRFPDKRFTPQFFPATADNPPPTARNWLQGIVSQWEVSWSAQTQHITLQGTPDRVDNPPFGLRPYLTWTLPQFELTWDAQARKPIGWLPDGPVPPIPPVVVVTDSSGGARHDTVRHRHEKTLVEREKERRKLFRKKKIRFALPPEQQEIVEKAVQTAAETPESDAALTAKVTYLEELTRWLGEAEKATAKTLEDLFALDVEQRVQEMDLIEEEEEAIAILTAWWMNEG